MTTSGIVLNVDTINFERRLTKIEKRQLPFAHLLTLNRTAFDTMMTTRSALPYFVDRPKGYTVRAIRYWKATKRNPVAQVFIVDDPNKGTAPSEYLRPIIKGGRRSAKPGERQLQRRGILPSGYGYVPAKSLKLDRYGNVSQGNMTKILSAIGGFGEEGYQANRTQRSRARNRKRDEYFAVRVGSKGRDAHLTPGIYRRRGRRITPVLLFVPLPVYTAQFDFAKTVRREALRRYRQHFPRALQQALRTAR